MNKHFKSNERELVKVATFFKKQSKKLIAEGKLSEEHKKVEEAVDRFVAHMEHHANTRASILEQREQLKKLIKDDAQCPQCHTKDKLKFVGTEKNEKGWRSNRYKCRRCNIEFTWNRPNNPWDLISYITDLLGILQLKINDVATAAAEKDAVATTMRDMRANLEKLRPVIEAHDKEYQDLQLRETEMEKLIHEFKNSLMIEKIKMDTWENRNG